MDTIVTRHLAAVFSCCGALTMGPSEIDTYIAMFEQKAAICKMQQSQNKHSLKQCVQSKSLYTFLNKISLTPDQKQRIANSSASLSFSDICDGLYEVCRR